MKKYIIKNIGCDDETEFEIKLTDKQLEFVIKLFEKNNEIAYCVCTPHLYIYEYDENKKNPSWEYTDDLCLNRDYEELNGE